MPTDPVKQAEKDARKAELIRKAMLRPSDYVGRRHATESTEGHRARAIVVALRTPPPKPPRRAPAPPIVGSDWAPTPYVPDPNLPQAWVFDVDGTLARRGDHDGVRGWFDEHRVGEDGDHPAVVSLAVALADLYAIVVITARTEACRTETLDWLNARGIFPDLLVMRPAPSDGLDDAILKDRLFDEHIAPRYRVLGVFDDRPKVVRMWRAKGLMCAQTDARDWPEED